MSSYANNKAWRKRNPKCRQEGKQRYYKQFEDGAFNKKKRWLKFEMDMIIDKEYSDRIIAGKIGRSVKAIQMKRLRVKKEIL